MNKDEADSGSSKPAEASKSVVTRPTFLGRLRATFASWWGSVPVNGRNETASELSGDRTDLAATRTLMAADRTLMAWVRTSMSLSSFGFTIYKVLQGFAESGIHLPHGHSPRVVGLFLTTLGTLAMVMGSVEYVQALRELRKYMEIKLARPAFVMAVLMGLVGLALFISIVTSVF